MNSVYPSNQQVVNPNLTNEKIFSVELGYGFKTSTSTQKLTYTELSGKTDGTEEEV